VTPNLTSDPPRNELEEVQIMGRTVLVSHESESAYVPFGDELVSMTNLEAWNRLIEEGKRKAIDGYEEEQSLAEKQLERDKERLASDLREMARDIEEKARAMER